MSKKKEVEPSKRKVTWSDIFDDFKIRHPNLKSKAIHYQPHDYLTIVIWFSDGMKMEYDYFTHTGKFV